MHPLSQILGLKQFLTFTLGQLASLLEMLSKPYFQHKGKTISSSKLEIIKVCKNL